MIRQTFNIPRYDWRVRVYYYLDTYYIQEILDLLKSIGCKQRYLEDARIQMVKDAFNSGLCYSHSSRHETIIVIARATSDELFVNSCFHEAKHLLSHIEQEFDINPYSEEAAYLSGYIGLKMLNTAKLFLCNCSKHELNKLKGT